MDCTRVIPSEFRWVLPHAKRPIPSDSEFGIVADEIMFGLDQSVAIENMCKRVGQPDLNFFATAITIQSQTGGNLAEILSRLSDCCEVGQSCDLRFVR